MGLDFAAFALVGYVVCVAPARLCHRDIGSFRRTLWAGSGNRANWRRGILLAVPRVG